MAANIQSSAPSQSQAEVRAYLEEGLRAQYPSANNQEINRAIDAALGRHGYVLHRQEQRNNQQEHVQREQRNGQNESGQRGERNQQQALAAVRDAAITAAQPLADPAVRLAAVASAWLGYAAASALLEQNQQNQQRQQRN